MPRIVKHKSGYIFVGNPELEHNPPVIMHTSLMFIDMVKSMSEYVTGPGFDGFVQHLTDVGKDRVNPEAVQVNIGNIIEIINMSLEVSAHDH